MLVRRRRLERLADVAADNGVLEEEGVVALGALDDAQRRVGQQRDELALLCQRVENVRRNAHHRYGTAHSRERRGDAAAAATDIV